MLRQPINFVYAAFVITLIGGGTSMYILKNAYKVYSDVYFTQAEIVMPSHFSKLN
jgi:hypothetical protein